MSEEGRKAEMVVWVRAAPTRMENERTNMTDEKTEESTEKREDREVHEACAHVGLLLEYTCHVRIEEECWDMLWRRRRLEDR